MRSRIGSHQQQLNSMLSDNISKQENITETTAEQSDTDYAQASAELTSEGLFKTQSALAAMTQARSIQQEHDYGAVAINRDVLTRKSFSSSISHLQKGNRGSLSLPHFFALCPNKTLCCIPHYACDDDHSKNIQPTKRNKQWFWETLNL